MEDNEKDFFGDTHTLLTEYVDDRILLLKIQAAEKSGKLISTLVTMAVVALFSFMILIFVSLMGGYYFAELTGSKVLGFGLENCLKTFNWGVGYYIFAPKEEVAKILKIGKIAGYELKDIGIVEKGKRQVIFEPGKIILTPPGK